MDIDLKIFSPSQQHALFGLLILAMYADGHLTTAEDEQLQRLLVAMGYTDEIDQHREFDSAVTKTRPFLSSIQAAKDQALLLADAFSERAQQRLVIATVESLMTSDGHVTTWESILLSELRMKFRL